MCQAKEDRHPVEILAPDGPHEIISIADEQQAPVADLSAFKEALAAFTREDYLGIAPYDLLVRFSQFAWNQFDQFAAVLLNAAQTIGVEEVTVKAAIQMYRDIFMDMAGDATDIFSAIRAAASDEEHQDQVSVLSIPCGSGKSTALTRMIHDVIQRDDGKGLVIITDSIERMNEYWKPDTKNPGFDDGLLTFIASHQNEVAVINRQNYEQMRIRQYYAPVVILTTQRYFGWTKERIQELLRWKNGTRPLIIFDEAPYLSEERDITVETINAIDSALRMKIEAVDEESRKEKDEALAYWKRIRTALLHQMEELEYTSDLQYALITGKETEIVENFLSYVRENQSLLDTNILKIVQMAEDIALLLQQWGVYSHRSTEKSGKYESKYTVHIDHRDLVTDLGAKVIILDGTAALSPMYDEDYIHMVQSRNFARSLSCLTIRLCDLPSGESDLRTDRVDMAKMIHAYLNAATNSDQNLVLFSSEKMEAAFRAIGCDKEHTGHFNNIKGLNSYSAAINIAQVGLNRKPPVDYLTLDLARNEEVRTQLAEETKSGNAIAAMKNAREALNYSVKTMTRHVLADLEQNLYRGIIRNAANTQSFTYYVFFEHENYQELIRLIRERFETLGARMECVERTAIEAFKMKSTMELRIAAFEQWLESWDGSAIRQSEVYSKLGMSRNDFNNMLAHECAKNVKHLLDEARKNASDAGLKKGWLKR